MSRGHHDTGHTLVMSSKENENERHPYPFNLAGTIRSFIDADLRLVGGLYGCIISAILPSKQFGISFTNEAEHKLPSKPVLLATNISTSQKQPKSYQVSFFSEMGNSFLIHQEIFTGKPGITNILKPF